MFPRKSKDVQLKNLLNEYIKKRSTFSFGQISENKPSTPEQNEDFYQKYNKTKTPIFEFKKFCSMTGLHGFKHFVENNFNKYGKFFWAICLVAIYILCGVSIYILINSFRERPAIISLDNSLSSIWTIPFPAITVCSSNKIRPSVYDKLNNNNTDSDDQLIRSTVHGICENNFLLKQKLKLSEEYIDGSFVTQVLKNMSFPCKEVIIGFSWLQTSDDDPCNSWFQETFTSYGLCHSFNMMPMGELLKGDDEWSKEKSLGWKNYRSTWQPDTGYDDDKTLNSHLPMRAIGNTDFNSATFKLDIHTDDSDKECAQGMNVFYILVHNPADFPDRSHPTFVFSTNSLSTLAIRPFVLTTSTDLTSWDAQSRRCYFQKENKLKFFKIYTQNNCFLECKSIYILSQCGCVPFYHIRAINTPVCGPAKMSCFVTASQYSTDSCKCLPGCSELYYKISSMNVPFNRSASLLYKKLSDWLTLSVYYQNKNYFGINRIMTFTFVQFMGNVGGIMGLCLGFSFLSLAEIIYFLTLRPLVNYCNSRKEERKVNPIDIVRNNMIAYLD